MRAGICRAYLFVPIAVKSGCSVAIRYCIITLTLRGGLIPQTSSRANRHAFNLDYTYFISRTWDADLNGAFDPPHLPTRLLY